MKIQGYKPRESQKGIFKSLSRFIVAVCGRRWGKTLTGMNWLMHKSFKHKSLGWWIAPVYAQSRSVYRRLLRACRSGGAMEAVKRYSDTELMIEFIDGTCLFFKSADKPENLRGEGLRAVVLDECALMRKRVWEEIIRPATSDVKGEALFITTPKGKNWVYQLYSRGKDKLEPEWESFQYPTSDNPKVPDSDLEEAQRNLPEDVWKQEFLAEFLDDNAGVFRHIKECIGSKESDRKSGVNYYAGLDLAKYTDFTVLTILDEKGNQIYFDRFNKLDWSYQKKRILSPVNKYEAFLFMDSTGAGEPIYEEFSDQLGSRVNPMKFTNENKKRIIEELALSIQNKDVNLLDIEVQSEELEFFGYEILESGRIRYSAPEGSHDDTVIALALANWSMKNQKHAGFIFSNHDVW